VEVTFFTLPVFINLPTSRSNTETDSSCHGIWGNCHRPVRPNCEAGLCIAEVINNNIWVCWVNTELFSRIHFHLTFSKFPVQLGNLIHKCFCSMDTFTLLKACVTYVRPVLEYAPIFCSPYTLKLLYQAESVQRHFTKRLPGCGRLSYSDRLTKFGLESFELRRLKSDLLYAYKILHGSVDINYSSDFFSFRHSRMRGHDTKLFMQQQSYWSS